MNISKDYYRLEALIVFMKHVDVSRIIFCF